MAAPAHIARENGKKGGRPPGAPAKMTYKKALELSNADRTPLDVMIDNMNFWWDQAKDLGEQLKNLVVDEMDNAAKADALQKIGRFLAARENAQKCAVDAAPYVHPKFTSISVKAQISNIKIQMAVGAAITQAVQDDSEPAKRVTNGHAA